MGKEVVDMYTRFYIVCITTALLLVGCSSTNADPTVPLAVPEMTAIEPQQTAISSETTLISALADHTFLFQTNDEQYELYTYNMLTGEQKTVHTQQMPIRDVKVHPSGETFLVVSAPSATLANITLYSLTFEAMYEVEIPSYEVLTTFDTVHPQQFAVTAFNDQFDATVYQFTAGTLQQVAVPYPFVSMRDNVLYTVTEGKLQQTKDGLTEVLANDVTYAKITTTGVYYVTQQTPNTLITSEGAITLLQPIVSLEEQHGDMYVWTQQQQHYELTTLNDMMPLLTVAKPVPFYHHAEQHILVYGDFYEWVITGNDMPLQWLTINQ